MKISEQYLEHRAVSRGARRWVRVQNAVFNSAAPRSVYVYCGSRRLGGRARPLPSPRPPESLTRAFRVRVRVRVRVGARFLCCFSKPAGSAVLARHCGARSGAASSAAAVRSAASCARHRSCWRSDDAGRRWRLRCFADEELRLLTRSAAAASRVPSASTRCDVESSWPPRVPHAVFSLRCGEWWLRRRAVVGASTTAHALRLPAPQPACRRHRRSTPSKRAFLAVVAGN